MSDGEISVKEPIVAGGLFSGLEVLALLGVPLWVLVFSVVHAMQVADVARAFQATLAADEVVDIWSVVVNPWLLLFSGVVSLAIAFSLIVVIGGGTLLWRVVAGGVNVAADRRSHRRYRTLVGNDEMAADAWDGEE